MKSGSWLDQNVRLVQLVGVLLCLPVLIFWDQLPTPLLIVALSGLAIVALLGIVVTRQPVVMTPIDLPLWLYVLLAPVSLLVTVDRAETVAQLLKVIAGAALFYGVVGAVHEKPNRLALMPWILTVASIGFTALVLLGTDWRSTAIGPLLRQFDRDAALRFHPFWKPGNYLGFNPNLSGGALAMLIPIPFAYAIGSGLCGTRIKYSKLTRVGAAAVSLMMAFALLLTESRGAVLALVCGVGVILLGRNWRWATILGGVVAVSLVVIYIVHSGGAIAALASADTADVVNSAEDRLELWSRAVYIMQDFPFTGIGVGAVGTVLPLFYPTFLIPPTANIDHLHNLFLNTGAEMGIGGVIAQCGLLIGLLVLSVQAFRCTRDSAESTLILALLASEVVLCAHGMLDAVTYSPKVHLIAWGLWGIAVAADLQGLTKGAREGNVVCVV